MGEGTLPANEPMFRIKPFFLQAREAQLSNSDGEEMNGRYLASMKGRMSLVIARVPWMLICRMSSISC